MVSTNRKIVRSLISLIIVLFYIELNYGIYIYASNLYELFTICISQLYNFSNSLRLLDLKNVCIYIFVELFVLFIGINIILIINVNMISICVSQTKIIFYKYIPYSINNIHFLIVCNFMTSLFFALCSVIIRYFLS